jgi:glycosyltransferase involved in cell wall biosynthesis
MRIAMLAPIAWRTPPGTGHPPPDEALVARGIDVTLFATRNSLATAKLDGVVPAPYCEDPSIDAKVWEYRHLAYLFERADRFDIIHNQADFPAHAFSALVRTPMVTTIHGFSSERILPMYKPYEERVHFVAISNANRHPELRYAATIHHGIRVEDFTLIRKAVKTCFFFGRIDPDKGTKEAIEVANACGRTLHIYGIIQDGDYFERSVKPKTLRMNRLATKSAA